MILKVRNFKCINSLDIYVMNKTEKVAQSYQKLAQILATISGGLFVASGVFGSMYNQHLSTAVDTMKTWISVSKSVNRTLQENVTEEFHNAAMTSLESSQMSLNAMFIVLGAATFLAFLSFGFWRKSHKKLTK